VSVSTVTPPPTVNKFKVGDRVQVSGANLNVRQTPSTSGALLGTQNIGALGTVTAGPTTATGYTWWNINYDSGADGWSIEDNLTITTTPAPNPNPTPNPGPVGQACANEPAGWKLIDDRNFAAPDSNWNSYGGGFSIVKDPTAPDGDGSVGQAFYSAIGRRVGSGTYSSLLLPDPALRGKGYTGVYTCYWFKVDPTYTGEASGVNKQFWFQVGTTAENRVFAELAIPTPAGQTWSPTATFPAYASFRVQGLGNVVSSAAQLNKNYPMSRGVWHQIEFKGQLESSKGATDGYLTMWMDGQLMKTYSGLQFTHTGEPLEWYGVKWNNTYGGGSAFCTSIDPTTGALPTQSAHPECFVPHDQYIWMDHQRVLAN
jgi:hypothetical protein